MATSYSVRHLGEVPSTQDVARAEFDGRPILVTATRQTSGRGRTGASWVNAPGALACSLAFTPEWETRDLLLLPLLGGLAAARHIGGATLKWPNDVILNGSKVAGILTESSDGVVVVGMGVNLWWPDSPRGYGAILSAPPTPGDRENLAEGWVETFLEMVDRGPDQWPRAEYRQKCETLGRSIEWDPEGSGRATDIGTRGELHVETGAGVVRLTSSAVRHVRSPN